MADWNLCAVANRVLGLLRSEEVGEIGSPECQRLEEAITRVAPLLLDAENKCFENDGVFFGLSTLGRVLRDAEDFLEAAKMMSDLKRCNRSSRRRKGNNIVKKMAKQVRALLFSASLPSQEAPFFLQPPYNGIEATAHWVDESVTKLTRLNLVELCEKEIQVPAQVMEEAAACPSLIDEWSSIRAKDIAEVVDLLLDEDRKFEVLGIVGEAGADEKAIFVRRVFDDDKVQTHFDLRIWVDFRRFNYVTRILIDQYVLKEIVACSTRKSPGNIVGDIETLQKLAKDALHDKRYLIVLEVMDCANEEGINSIIQSLQNGALGRIILVDVGFRFSEDVACVNRDYRLEYLSEKESWGLFKKALRGMQQPIKYSLVEDIGFKLLGKRENRNLFSIMMIGSRLHCEDYYNEEELRLLCENELFPLPQFHERLNPFLKLSYSCLASPLKHCFAYCSLFPQGHEIDVQTLIRLWISQGFIVTPATIGGKSYEDLEDIGYEYFLNLFGRFFFHEAKLDGRWRVTKCKMLQPVHKLATSISKVQCRLITIWDDEDEIFRKTVHNSSVSNSFSEKYFKEIFNNLRSLLFPTQRGRKADHLILDWDKVFSCSRFLRALDMHACGIKEVPYSIGDLKHLRYLDLSENTDLMELPNSITKLLNLQTLRLSSCISLKKLPQDIRNLVNLRHLENDGCYSLSSLPRGFGQLTNLLTLSQVILNENSSRANEELKELSQLSNLREVQIKILRQEMGENISVCLKAMKRVRSLLLEWESRVPELNNFGAQLSVDQFPDLEELTLLSFRNISGVFLEKSIPRYLSKIVLRRCGKCKIFPPLDQCLKLKVLVLDEMPDLEYVSKNFSAQVCSSLQELWLTELLNLKGWCSEVNVENLLSFPRLSKLVIEDCPNLASLPLFPTLEEGLVLDSTSWKPFELTMATPHPSEASSSSYPPLSKLKSLCIVNIDEFDGSKAEEIAWNTLTSLQLLKLDFLQNLNTLPEGLQKVNSLREFHVWRWGGKEIPSWIGKLKSLERLVIRVCPDLETLPEEIMSLKHFKTLEIEDCPTLLRRCQKGIGADWYKIAHIPQRRLGQISRK